MLFTIDEYKYYTDTTYKLFNYMNGRINQLNNKCVLIINSYDFINNTYGNIRYPNEIIINVGTIINGWRDEWAQFIDKREYVNSSIAWAISHELHHADQLIAMTLYNTNSAYKNEMENDVERASYDWVLNHAKELSAICGCKISIDKLDSNTLTNSGNYTKANTREFYLQTIANVVIRDLSLFEELKVFTNDHMCEDMILIFNNTDTVVIKSNGKFLDENINLFSDMVYKHCHYNKYNVYIDIGFSYNSASRCMATVQFTISDPILYPMQFRDSSLMSY